MSPYRTDVAVGIQTCPPKKKRDTKTKNYEVDRYASGQSAAFEPTNIQRTRQNYVFYLEKEDRIQDETVEHLSSWRSTNWKQCGGFDEPENDRAGSL